ncbi:MAG: 2,3-butanediol dehydrogenase [Gammaproteobacteria bacterium]|jgi:(R,R)-butanediol dehydrogenase/meso-butanediol dehydrogenase/diacetyl reductase|uniref:2,3-butanediol dehydrogenase n=1 Tax=Marinomonas TaxID=28253 RepID=UPI000C2842CB|nr:2,3-butanediol dehydrogenase [Marinomonas sp. ef1]MBU1294567.1 2,3-butanediol dehydrogenase [Gammaproteobacteria bacterium]MBU1465645.1 2,3-butanediol dehydrogenase [Gammaproteobacteria bacterium]MBU2024688.1 2,3-butanediol dehydrogenase [Gammaproteobacteria bacterium]MBU2238831.1 2,3-butanediol dehydrogenase [Gammaproteobacteria bacterium]MBU2412973.1 2,3-butanediol dehydrogenase [Gammaproteobacteria bacterium]|tara:strand:+ start:2044 stop:3102 length:1059 start_codon:yes stop_codon:yes gene_type:complete
MKAARFYDRGDIRIEDIPEPSVEPGTVGIDVAWCGICGTDLHEFMEGPIFIPPCGHPHPISGESAPVTMGHEFSGVVYAVGEGVEDIKIGQHVVVEPYIIADDVPTGPGENYHLSKNMNFIGLGGCGGGLSEKIAVKRRWVHPIANSIPLDQAALIEPLAVGYHAFVRSGAKAGDVALVGGGGPIGLLLSAVLKAKGITVIMTELSAKRKEKALDTGVADYILDPTEVNVTDEVMKITENRGVDVAFECTSNNKVLDTLVESTRSTGTIVIVSIWSHPATVNVHSVVMKELDIRGTIAYVNNHEETIKLVEEGKVNLEPFITQRIELDDLISQGFDTLIHNNESAVKIIVRP